MSLYIQRFVNGETAHAAIGSDRNWLPVFEVDAAGKLIPLSAVFPGCLRFMPYAEPCGDLEEVDREALRRQYSNYDRAVSVSATLVHSGHAHA